MLWVGKFMFVPHGAVGWSVCVYRLVLWVGQFMFVPHDAVGWSVCVSFSQCCGLVSLCLFLAVLWVDQLSVSVALYGHNYFIIVSIRLYAEHQITNSKYQSLQFFVLTTTKSRAKILHQ